jgi:hypothetical protein
VSANSIVLSDSRVSAVDFGGIDNADITVMANDFTAIRSLFDASGIGVRDSQGEGGGNILVEAGRIVSTDGLFRSGGIQGPGGIISMSAKVPPSITIQPWVKAGALVSVQREAISH